MRYILLAVAVIYGTTMILVPPPASSGKQHDQWETRTDDNGGSMSSRLADGRIEECLMFDGKILTTHWYVDPDGVRIHLKKFDPATGKLASHTVSDSPPSY